MMTTSAVSAETLLLSTPHISFAYRQIGNEASRPLVLLNHLAANLDNWDPDIIDGLSSKMKVYIFDNAGVGASSGVTPKSIEAMADDAATFIQSLGVGPVDLLGLSMGGMVAQELVMKYPKLVRKLVLVGTGPRGGQGIDKVTRTTMLSILKGGLRNADPKEFIFFARSVSGKVAAKKFLARLEQRTSQKDSPVAVSAFIAQLRAIRRFASAEPQNLGHLSHPTFIVNGDNDIMVPSKLSIDLAQRIPTAELEIFEDSGHGSLFQYPMRFVSAVISFLDK
jgi:pimeloyl-ACP methyl ester carboxylesterase